MRFLRELSSICEVVLLALLRLAGRLRRGLLIGPVARLRNRLAGGLVLHALRVLHTGDLHIGNFPGPEKDGENVRFLDICRCLDALVAGARELIGWPGVSSSMPSSTSSSTKMARRASGVWPP